MNIHSFSPEYRFKIFHNFLIPLNFSNGSKQKGNGGEI